MLGAGGPGVADVGGEGAAGVAAPVVPVVAPHHVKPVGPKKPPHPDWPVPGGKIIFTGLSLDAHCNIPSHNTERACKLDRTVTPVSSARGRGRPLGLLVAWLIHGAACIDRVQHKASIQLKRPEDVAALSPEARQRARAWLQENCPELLHGKERLRVFDEPDEPAGIV